MKIAAAENLNLLWILPVMLVFIIWRIHSANKALTKFASNPILKHLTLNVSVFRKTFKIALRFIALMLLLICLLRPQWGYKMEEIKRRGLDIFILLDVSKSMLADDVKPNRLQRAKREIKDLLKVLKGDRIGIIPFAGRAFVSCPLTLDYATAKMFLNDISLNSIPVGGTNFARAIAKAKKGFINKNDKDHNIIIIISDGEKHDTKAIDLAKENNVKIYTVGVGTPDGTPISLKGKDNTKTFMRNRDGNIIMSKLNEKFLKDLALSSGGAYARAGLGNLNLENIYLQHITGLEKKELKSLKKKKYTERFLFLLIPAIILLIVEFFMNDKKKIKR